MNDYKAFIDSYLDNILAVLAVLFCGLFVCGIICIPYYFFRKKYKRCLLLQSHGKIATGKIEHIYEKMSRIRGDENTPTIYSETPHAIYSFEADGNLYSGDLIQKKKEMYQIGDRLKVYYNPENPKKNCTDRHLENGANVNKLFIGLLCFMAVLTIVLMILC